MKKIIFNGLFIVSVVLVVSSCKSISDYTTKKMTGSTEKDLINYVAVDTGCSKEQIAVKDKAEQAGNAVYILSVCGKEMKYRRTGSVFYKDGENPLNK